MKAQTYKVEHHIYINGDPSSAYVVADILGDSTFVRVGPSLTQHENHMKAIDMCGDADLYIKIDDDDIYRPRYIENIVRSYMEGKWDYSAGHSNGIILGTTFRQGTLQSLCVDPTEEELQEGIVMFMPPTLALNSSALEEIRNLKPEDMHHSYEDIVWRNRLWYSEERFLLRDDQRFTRDFTYVVHGANISTSGWLPKPY
jgi:hypothetical protein